MQYQVLVQNESGNRYLASIIGVPDCIAEGATREQAVAKAKAALNERLAQGEIVTIEVESPSPVNPLLKHAGRFKDDPTFDVVMAEIEKYRHELDAEAANE